MGEIFLSDKQELVIFVGTSVCELRYSVLVKG